MESYSQLNRFEVLTFNERVVWGSTGRPTRL